MTRFELLLVRPRRNTFRDRCVDHGRVVDYLLAGNYVGQEDGDPAISVWTGGGWIWTDVEVRFVVEEGWVPTDPAFIDHLRQQGRPETVSMQTLDQVAHLYPIQRRDSGSRCN